MIIINDLLQGSRICGSALEDKGRIIVWKLRHLETYVQVIHRTEPYHHID